MSTVGDMLSITGSIGAALAEHQGGKVLQNGKKVMLDLNKSDKSVYKKLRKLCPNAKEPKMLLESNSTKNANNIRMQFYDGNTTLSSGFLEHQTNGTSVFDVLITDASGVQQVSTRGSYNPKRKFFTKKNYGVSFEERNGYKKGHADSDGFDIKPHSKRIDVFLLSLNTWKFASLIFLSFAFVEFIILLCIALASFLFLSPR